MKELIKTICFVLITLAILVGVSFYCWQTYEYTKIYQAKFLIDGHDVGRRK